MEVSDRRTTGGQCEAGDTGDEPDRPGSHADGRPRRQGGGVLVRQPTLYYTFERPLVDGTPEFEIRAAAPENAPFPVVARIPASRVPIWQIVNPALSPDGRSMAQALTDGFTTNVWVLSIASGEWRQLLDFGDRPTFIARRVSWSSDGRFILAAVGEGDADIVLLEGLANLVAARH
jgi:hypothetical protein